MYELYLKVQNELAFLKDSGVGFCRKKKAVPRSEEQPFLIYKVRGLITEHLLLSKQRSFREQLLR